MGSSHSAPEQLDGAPTVCACAATVVPSRGDYAAARPAAGAPPAPATLQDVPALWIRAVARLPFAILYVLAEGVAWLLRYVVRYRLAVARENLRRCFPNHSRAEVNRLLRAYYRHLAQVAVELLKIAAISADELSARVTLVNMEPVHAELRAGRSVLLLGAHQCNWEWSLHAVALGLGVPMDAAYKPPHAAAADRELRKLRCRFGARLIAAKKLLREIARHRREVHAVALIADQVPATSDGRLWLSFLGRDTAFYPGPAEIARSTGYAAFFAAMRRTRRGYYEIEFQPVSAAGEKLEPAVFTQRYARLLEALICAHPSDWTWTHRRWKLSRPCELGAVQPASADGSGR